MSDLWIIVSKWDEFQHYKDRNPVWIKLFTELRNKDEWRHLTLAQRGLLVSIWIEYAAADGQLRAADLPSLILQKLPLNSLDSLNHAGWIQLAASKPPQIASPRARPRTREETETETDLPKSLQRKTRDHRKRTGYKMVRGSHGVSYLPDPDGTDPLPTGWQG